MIWIAKVLIGRSSQSLNRAFSYASNYENKPIKLTRVIVDFGNSKDVIAFVAEDPKLYEGTIEEYNEEYGFKLQKIKFFIDKEPIITPELDAIAKEMADYYLCPLISIYQAMLPPSLKPKDSSLNKPKEQFEIRAKANSGDTSKLNKIEIELYNKILNANGMFKIDSTVRKKVSYKTLLSSNLVEEYKFKKNRIKEVEGRKIEVNLNDEQKEVIDKIYKSNNSYFLLKGIAGSGKTIVYLELAKRMLKEGKGSIILVPEIALTDQTASIFKGEFGNDVSILHSSLTAANKYDEFLRIKNGQSKIVIGTRSAIFAPVKNLSLIFIDEEQSSSYKQDSTPFYDARTVAKMRSKIEGCKVVLSSATPLVEDNAKAEKGIYEKLVLTHKYSSSPNVNAKFIDMSDIRNFSRYSTLISIPLANEIKETISRNEQVILFINRRGFSPLVQCRKCGKNYICPNCETPMTYHNKDKIVWCHRCDARKSISSIICEKCGESNFMLLGYGTEKIKEHLSILIPEGRSVILDRDSCTEAKRNQILTGFRNHLYDILIGTEMVVKGHDFPNVTLVAALDADRSLSFPSYLASEDTFDLISQLVGRSGRSNKEGKAFIQANNVLNKTLIYASRQDYDGFYEYEMTNRKKYLYPPYVYICNIVISGMDANEIMSLGYQIKAYLSEEFKKMRVNIYGPSIPIVGTINKKHFVKIMLKYKDINEIQEGLAGIEKIFNNSNNSIEITIDIDSRGD